MENGMELHMREEFASLDFNSKRLEQRFIKTMETLARQPDKSIWFSSENRAEAKAIYRMLGNEELERGEILRTHREATVGRMARHGGTILAVQDTTSLNYNTQTKMEGIGYVCEQTLGANIHSRLAVTTDGLVLGALPSHRIAAKSRATRRGRMRAKKSGYWRKRKATDGRKRRGKARNPCPKEYALSPYATAKGICTNCLTRRTARGGRFSYG